MCAVTSAACDWYFVYYVIITFCFQRIVSVGLDEHSTINVWEWQKGKLLSTVRGHTDKVSHVTQPKIVSHY